MSKKEEKGKKDKKTGAWSYYVVDLQKKEVKLTKKKCPRCGNFLAFHSEGRKRYYCGSCHYTEFVAT
ncbi:MAG: 30S ribosomal protein S27ae [Thermoproteota archaeon]|jgi:small subunit ribosomal protein S27Ae